MAGLGVWLIVEDVNTAKILAAFGGAAAVAILPWGERWLRVRLPAWLKLWFGLFIMGSLIVGTVFDMYGHWHPWDAVLHLTSGVLVAGFGMVLLHQRFGKLRVVLPIWGRTVLIGMFSATVALLWEVAEFTSDSFFGTFSQHNDVVDTMLDMIYGTTTGVLTAAAYYSYKKLAARRKK